MFKVILFFGLTACSVEEEGVKVVATSSWTEAYARAAGIEEVRMLAPSNMQHPSEYELRIDDIRRLKNAEMVVAGGYETMLDEIRSGLDIDPDKIMQIKTDYNFDHMKESILSIASAAGTNDIALKNIEELQQVFEQSGKMLQQAGIKSEPVYVQFFMQSLANELGLNIVGTFGPEHLEAFHIQDIMDKDFSLIIDNAHNPTSKPLVESKDKVDVVYLINFPGMHNTESLVDVIRHNVQEILERGN